jgi:hypothetical protein
VNLERTRILSPANGYVTNLLVQLGGYVNAGVISISVVDANSFLYGKGKKILRNRKTRETYNTP